MRQEARQLNLKLDDYIDRLPWISVTNEWTNEKGSFQEYSWRNDTQDITFLSCCHPK